MCTYKLFVHFFILKLKFFDSLFLYTALHLCLTDVPQVPLRTILHTRTGTLVEPQTFSNPTVVKPHLNMSSVTGTAQGHVIYDIFLPATRPALLHCVCVTFDLPATANHAVGNNLPTTTLTVMFLIKITCIHITSINQMH